MRLIDDYHNKTYLHFYDPLLTAGVNGWSKGVKTTIPVKFPNDVDPSREGRYITWRGDKFFVSDYELFVGIIKSWVHSRMYPMSKEEALSQWFSIEKGSVS